ncbi:MULTISPECIES: RagB/SusD family nutrient uptake outer membrane protein [unclassified Lentimicrobium]|uniref:RagB/SusD family nutrient uptake outer membrane protein n=1 Tax=unclassified Lentimicrobium TaxID=2677434 RepID=UPI00155634FA|nr:MULTISPECIES: RagB/SusD family nutrient uptake outer membrane protein [unclassified Lentimicrobium]NPD47319.1 RagB/SusD family nutrient uptake outer membrane protein [Lentimicrobium sp. S6]NPD84684.1 RagB/SusD family nutrient uptake outer membrane protein [Lentimicrobium sp. L6]
MKNLLYKTIMILGFIGLMITINSCSDNFVQEAPEYSIDSENYFNSEDDYYKALVGAYDLLQPTYQNVIVGEIASDNTLCGGESPTDVIGWQQIDDMIHTPVNSNLREIWSLMFSGVQRCNYFMEYKDKTDFDGREAMIGEIRFLRAYYHFELVKWFGGIPLKIDERFQLGDELNIPRSSVDEVYAQIEADLIAAAAVLPDVPLQQGRATKGAALSLLGKAYLYQEEFTKAATTLDEVINSGVYVLADNYNSIFEHEGENGPESVFEVQYTDLEGAGFGCLQCSEGNVAVGFSGVRSYDGPLFSSGFSFNVPTAEAASIYSPGDHRLGVTILDIVAWSDTAGAGYSTGNEHTGYFNRKYIPRKRSENAQNDLNLTNPNNYRAIRYSDVLLMAAEANNRGGISDAKAQDYLNQVRRRAFTDENHDITLSGADLTEAIYHERRLELFGEGHRFFDLVRTGKAASVIDGFVVGKHEVFPIPLEEINFSAGNWSQNPNY